MNRIHKTYYSANARYLSDEAIKDIKTSFGRVPDAINTMAKKYRISVSRAKEYIENQEQKQQMIDSYPSQIQSTISSEITSISLDPKVKTSDRQIKKRLSKPKSIRVSDLSTINDTQIEQALNEGEKQIEESDHKLNSHFVFL
ncbi:11986_t:CDS:2, partial [Ambispora gerdemannii]